MLRGRSQLRQGLHGKGMLCQSSKEFDISSLVARIEEGVAYFAPDVAERGSSHSIIYGVVIHGQGYITVVSVYATVICTEAVIDTAAHSPLVNATTGVFCIHLPIVDGPHLHRPLAVDEYIVAVYYQIRLDIPRQLHLSKIICFSPAVFHVYGAGRDGILRGFD